MTIPSLFSWPDSCARGRRGNRSFSAARRKRARLFLEQLEVRVTPSFGLSSLAFFGTIVGVEYASGPSGATPQWALIMDGSGDLYGTAAVGGADGDGTVFELAKGSNTVTALASFNGTDGAYPYGALIMDSSGNLYGTTDKGGAMASAPFSSWTRRPAPSPPWRRSTAATGNIQLRGWSWTRAATCMAPPHKEAQMAMAPFSRSRPAAAPSTTWSRSTAVTAKTRGPA